MSDNEFKSQLLTCIEQCIIHFFITTGKSIWILQIADKDTKLWSPNELNIQIALRIIYPYISFRVVSSKHNEKMDNRKRPVQNYPDVPCNIFTTNYWYFLFTCIVTRMKDREQLSFHFDKSSRKSTHGFPVIISTVKVIYVSKFNIIV